jgi:hypothetical protein
VYIALRCQHCGELRQALASAPSVENVACPVCNTACNFLLLGRGLTSSQLPFHELHPREQTRWITHDADAGDIDTHNPTARNAEARTPEAREAEAPETLDGS